MAHLASWVLQESVVDPPYLPPGVLSSGLGGYALWRALVIEIDNIASEKSFYTKYLSTILYSIMYGLFLPLLVFNFLLTQYCTAFIFLSILILSPSHCISYYT